MIEAHAAGLADQDLVSISSGGARDRVASDLGEADAGGGREAAQIFRCEPSMRRIGRTAIGGELGCAGHALRKQLAVVHRQPAAGDPAQDEAAPDQTEDMVPAQQAAERRNRRAFAAHLGLRAGDAEPQARKRGGEADQRDRPDQPIPDRETLADRGQIDPVDHRPQPVPGPLIGEGALRDLTRGGADIVVAAPAVVQPHPVKGAQRVELLVHDPLVIVERAGNVDGVGPPEPGGDPASVIRRNGRGRTPRLAGQHPIARAARAGDIGWFAKAADQPDVRIRARPPGRLLRADPEPGQVDGRREASLIRRRQGGEGDEGHHRAGGEPDREHRAQDDADPSVEQGQTLQQRRGERRRPRSGL